MAKDYYETLGVRREATSDEIKRAYRRLARQLHPDVNPDAQTQERFKEVTAAYEVLADPEKRRVYDMGGDPLAPGGGFGGAGGPFGGFGFGDIMDAFFGGAGATARGPRGRARPGADALIRLEVDLAEAAFGVTREIPVDSAVVCPACRGAGTAEGTHPDTCSTCRGRGEVSTVTRSFLGQVMTSRPCPACSGTGSVIAHPCHDCSGEGRVRVRRNLTIKVPPGVESGMRIRLSGEGDVGSGGGPAGDLYVEIIELPHPVFTRDGDDLHCAVQLPMTAAALGTRARLETLEGETERIDIPAGTQSGTVVVLRGRGVPHLRGVGRGDLQVHLEVVTPTRLDPEQESLLRELARLRGEDGTDAGYSPATASSAGGGLFAKLRDAFR